MSWTTWTVTFSATEECDFGQNGNNSAQDAECSARTEQNQTYTPPSGTAICEVVPAIQNNAGGLYQWYFGYDDAVIMTYNGYVLFTTTDVFIDDHQ